MGFCSTECTIILEDSAILIFVVEEGGGTCDYDVMSLDITSHTILLLTTV